MPELLTRHTTSNPTLSHPNMEVVRIHPNDAECYAQPIEQLTERVYIQRYIIDGTYQSNVSGTNKLLTEEHVRTAVNPASAQHVQQRANAICNQKDNEYILGAWLRLPWLKEMSLFAGALYGNNARLKPAWRAAGADTTAQIEDVLIHPLFRGKGIGSLLLHTFASQFPARQLTRVKISNAERQVMGKFNNVATVVAFEPSNFGVKIPHYQRRHVAYALPVRQLASIAQAGLASHNITLDN